MASRVYPAPMTPEPERDRPSGALLKILLLAGGIYHGAFIYRTSFLLDGQRVFSLFDDAMISMRYARNLAGGHGLVWNPGGERVEGFTNPLWTFVMALSHLLPLPPRLMSLPIQVLGMAILLATALATTRLVRRLGGSERASLLAAALTLAYFPLVNWTLQGMEVGLLALLVTSALTLALRARGPDGPSWPLLLLLGAGTLVRLDAAVPFLTIGALHAARGASRREKVRRLLAAAGTLAGFLAVQTLARLWYYGDALPNTYYLKLTGFPLDLRLLRGLLVAVDFLLPLVPLLALAAWTLVRRNGSRTLAFPALLFFGQLAYSVWVGGDAWEEWGGANRYVCVAMPAVLAVLALTLDRFSERRPSPVTLPALLAGTLLLLNVGKGRESLRQWALLSRPPLVTLNSGVVALAHDLARLTRPEATLAVWWAGAIPYFADRKSLDILGKCDRRIARLPMHLPQGASRARAFYPGHMKWDLGVTVAGDRPDVVWSGAVPGPPDVFAGYVERRIRRAPVRLLRGSAHVRWDLIPAG
jgi:hypothetical protein